MAVKELKTDIIVMMMIMLMIMLVVIQVCDATQSQIDDYCSDCEMACHKGCSITTQCIIDCMSHDCPSCPR